MIIYGVYIKLLVTESAHQKYLHVNLKTDMFSTRYLPQCYEQNSFRDLRHYVIRAHLRCEYSSTEKDMK